MQEPKFFDSYKKALDESDMRTEAVLNTIQAVLGNLFSAFGIIAVIASMNWILACHHSSLHICTGKFEDRENEISVQHVLCEAKPYGRVHHKIILSTRIS